MKSKKDSSPPVPVTNLAIPVTDTPLVIDLPDGQKIVVGKLASGSVIEVATWRGTGRPDSRTNRIMLGMSNGADLPNSDSVTGSNAVEAKGNPAQAFLKKIQGLVKVRAVKPPKFESNEQAAENISSEKVNLPSKISLKLKQRLVSLKEKQSKLAPVDSTSEFDVDAWLKSIQSKSNEKPEQSIAPVKKAPVKKAPVKKAPVKKAPVKKAPVKKAPKKR